MGYGNLGRIFKIGLPNATYWIVDLPASLLYSSFFIKINFPNAKLCFVKDKDQLMNISSNVKYDFIFLPTGLLESMDHKINCNIDLIINTASLGEMDQTTVDSYFDLFSNQIKPRFFYSVNLFGSLNNACYYATPLNENWKILEWNIKRKHTFTNADRRYPSFLELLAERLPSHILPSEYRLNISKQLVQNAAKIIDKNKFPNEQWIFYMWESVRLFAGEYNLPIWLKFLSEAQFKKELYYFSNLYVKTCILNKREGEANRPIYIWPAGSNENSAFNVLDSKDVQIFGFIDNDSIKYDKMMGLQIYTPEHLKTLATNKENKPFIFIASEAHKDDISASLETMGYKKYIDYNYFTNLYC